MYVVNIRKTIDIFKGGTNYEGMMSMIQYMQKRQVNFGIGIVLLITSVIAQNPIHGIVGFLDLLLGSIIKWD